MELDELHVHERDAGAVGDRGSVSRRSVAVGRLAIDAAEAPGGEDRRLRRDQLELAVAHVVRDQPAADAVLDAERGGEVLFVDLDAEALELLPQGVQDNQAGDVGRVAGARRPGPTEGALGDAAVGHPREDAATVLEPDDLPRGVVGHRLDGVLVAQVVRALDAVEGVVLRRVVLAVPQRRVDTTLRRARVAADRVHFGDDRVPPPRPPLASPRARRRRPRCRA